MITHTAACHDEAKKTLSLPGPENIGHETPEHGYDKQVEDAQPDIKRPLQPRGGGVSFEQNREQDQVRNEKNVNGRNELAAPETGNEKAENRHDQQHGDKSAGVKPVEDFAVVRRYSAPEGTQHEISAKEKEKVGKSHRKTWPFAMLYLDQPFQKIAVLTRVGRLGHQPSITLTS